MSKPGGMQYKSSSFGFPEYTELMELKMSHLQRVQMLRRVA